MRTKLIIGTAVLVLVSAGAWYFILADRLASGKPVATVNGEEINRETYDELLAQTAKEQGFDLNSLQTMDKKALETQVVNTLITQALLLQAAAKAGITPPEGAVDGRISSIQTQFADEKAFRDALTEQNLTEEKLRSEIEKDLIIGEYLERELKLSAVTANEDEMRIAYDEAAAQDSSIPDFEEVKDQVKDFVIKQKKDEMSVQLVDKLRSQAQIEISL